MSGYPQSDRTPGGSSSNGQAARRRMEAERKAAARRRGDAMPRGCFWSLVVVGLLIIAGIVGGCNAYFNSTREVTVKINKTGMTCTSAKSCTNLVYTSGGVFKNSDAIGKTNSSDVMGELCPGATYVLQVRGWRNSVLSMWPNILKVEKVVTPAPVSTGCSNG